MIETMFVKRYPIRGASAAKNPSPPPPSHIRVGSYYEIDSSVLPLRSSTPEQLKSIRIVMVNKVTGRHVTLRYPSMYSLRSYFDFAGLNRTKPENKNKNKKSGGGSLLPVLDEGYVTTADLAGDLLYRRIPPHEVSLSRKSWSFWVSDDSHPAKARLYRAISPEGKCWSELRSRGMIKWGKRLRVRYQSRHIDCNNNKSCSRLKEEDDGTGKRKVSESKAETLAKRAKVFDQKMDNQIVVYKRDEIESSDLRAEKRRFNVSEKKKENQIVVYTRRSEKSFIDRWSVERYKLAEKNMLKVMKEKNAVFGNSMLRAELRSEARKLIGDTGLLDHLLKHMAGKVAPGGQDRFRRKHNADGAMEYWLESSDLVNLRKEAGVEDPYWTPPLGWKIGDSPTQDPVCAGEIRDIREELASLKREMEKLASKKEEEELAIMTTPKSCVTSQNVDHDSMMTPAKEIYADLLKKKSKIEDQLVVIAETLRKMEEDMGWLKKTVDENCPRMPDSTEMPFLLEDSPMFKTQEGEVKENQITESPQKARKDSRQGEPSLIHNTGFRICRPVASFSWPKLPALVAATDTDEFASSPSHRPSPVLPFPFTLRSPETPTNLFDL
ncbi:protein DYAD isoform X3 [Brassica rapa]|nr:protein DYAD isoform X3 [Brassica rapa]